MGRGGRGREWERRICLVLILTLATGLIVLYRNIYKATLAVSTTQLKIHGERETSSGNKQMKRRTQPILLPAEEDGHSKQKGPQQNSR